MRFRLQMVVDLVSGMRIDENTSQFKSKVNGNEVHFCCPGVRLDSNDYKVGYGQASTDLEQTMKELPVP
jgi:hypothetical protein